MNVKRLNESFSNKYRNHEIIDNSFKARFKNNLNESVNKLLTKGDTNISSLERALQEEIQRFTNKDWWEVTEVNIFGNLFESRDPHKTIDDIIENLKEGIDDDLEFIDNRKASIIYNDPDLDPGFDEYDVKDTSKNINESTDTWEIEYNDGAVQRTPVANETITVEGSWEDVLEELEGLFVDIPGEWDEDEEHKICSLDQFVDEYEEYADFSGSTVVLKIIKNDDVIYEISGYDDYWAEDYFDDDELEESKKKKSKLLDKVNKALSESGESKSIKEDYRGRHDLDDIIDFLQDHDQAWDDFCRYFDDVDDDNLTYDMVIDWLSEHDQLYQDFLNHYAEDYDIDESKSVEEDLEEDDYFDLQSDMYNKLSDIMFEYRSKDISEKDLNNAFEHFKIRFFDDGEESLNEARNKDNLEINDKIAQALRSKFQAKKYEKELNDLGITVQYLDGQGTMLTGPNGRSLSASRTTIYGPSRPEFNGTHHKGYIPSTYYEEKYLKRAQDRLNELQSLVDKADANILRVAYPGLSFEEATEKLTKDFEEAKDDVKKYTDRLNRERIDRDRALHNRKVQRGAGHSNPWIQDTEIEASVKESPIDFLTYLTKEKSALRTRKYPDERTPRIAKYHDLNDTIKRAENNLDWDKQYHKVLDQAELQTKLDELEAEFEAKVQQLLKQQDRNKSEIRTSYDRVDKAKKDKADYLKSLGIGN